MIEKKYFNEKIPHTLKEISFRKVKKTEDENFTLISLYRQNVDDSIITIIGMQYNYILSANDIIKINTKPYNNLEEFKENIVYKTTKNDNIILSLILAYQVSIEKASEI